MTNVVEKNKGKKLVRDNLGGNGLEKFLFYMVRESITDKVMSEQKCENVLAFALLISSKKYCRHR